MPLVFPTKPKVRKGKLVKPPSAPLPPAPKIEVTNVPAAYFAPWKEKVDRFVATTPPRSDNVNEYISAVAIRLRINENELRDYLIPRFKSGQALILETTPRQIYERTDEISDIVGTRLARAIKVLDDGMYAETITVDKEGRVHSTPDHRTRIHAASKYIETVGAARPSKTIVEHDASDKFATMTEQQLLTAILDLQERSAKLLSVRPDDDVNTIPLIEDKS